LATLTLWLLACGGLFRWQIFPLMGLFMWCVAPVRQHARNDWNGIGGVRLPKLVQMFTSLMMHR
jgi:hypothetical protein